MESGPVESEPAEDVAGTPSRTEATTPGPAPDRVLTVPNAISLVRLALVPVFALLIASGQDVAAIGVLVIAGISDWADGKIARRFNQVSALGRILDPAADRLYIAVTLVGLAWREIIPWWLVGLLALRDLAVGAVLPPLARRGFGPLPVHLVGKAGTAMLMYAFPLLLLAQLTGPLGPLAWAVGWATALWGVGLYWVAGVLYLRQAADILRTVPPPRSQTEPPIPPQPSAGHASSVPEPPIRTTARREGE